MLSLKNKQFPDLRSILSATSILVLLLFLASGCARKPWGDPFEEETFNTAKAEVAGYIARQAPCGKTMSADLAFFYESPLGRKAIKGFLELSEPKAFKFVVTNPFGQPLLAVVGKKKSFEAIITSERQFIAGGLESYAVRQKLPVEFFKGDLAAWLMARCQVSADQITDIREDQTGRGLWVLFYPPSQRGLIKSALLFDRESGRILERLIQNNDGETRAKITYTNWIHPDGATCEQPSYVAVTDLGYGTEIKLKLSNIEMSQDATEYDLKPPKGYLQQYLP